MSTLGCSLHSLKRKRERERNVHAKQNLFLVDSMFHYYRNILLFFGNINTILVSLFWIQALPARQEEMLRPSVICLLEIPP